jgi:hypothetical protein
MRRFADSLPLSTGLTCAPVLGSRPATQIYPGCILVRCVITVCIALQVLCSEISPKPAQVLDYKSPMTFGSSCLAAKQNRPFFKIVAG